MSPILILSLWYFYELCGNNWVMWFSGIFIIFVFSYLDIKYIKCLVCIYNLLWATFTRRTWNWNRNDLSLISRKVCLSLNFWEEQPHFSVELKSSKSRKSKGPFPRSFILLVRNSKCKRRSTSKKYQNRRPWKWALKTRLGLGQINPSERKWDKWFGWSLSYGLNI